MARAESQLYGEEPTTQVAERLRGCVQRRRDDPIEGGAGRISATMPGPTRRSANSGSGESGVAVVARRGELMASGENESQGVGPAATEAFRTILDRPKARRYWVLGPPSAAIDIAIGHLVAEGFVLRPDDFDLALRQRSSLWSGRTVEIGDVAMAKRLWWKRLPFRGDGVDLLCSTLWGGRLRRGIAPTLVAVVAQPAADGQSELVIAPARSGLGPIEDRDAAQPRLSRAQEAVGMHFAQLGHLLQQPEVVELKLLDAECPAQEDTIKGLINWPARDK